MIVVAFGMQIRPADEALIRSALARPGKHEHYRQQQARAVRAGVNLAMAFHDAGVAAQGLGAAFRALAADRQERARALVIARNTRGTRQ